MGSSHTWIEHTAELQLELHAGSQAGVFRQALDAMRELLEADAGTLGAQAERNVEVEATDRAALLAEWLAELVFLAEMEGLVPESVRDLVVAEDSVTGIVRGRLGERRHLDQGRDLPRPRAQARPRRLARERRARRLARPEASRALQHLDRALDAAAGTTRRSRATQPTPRSACATPDAVLREGPLRATSMAVRRRAAAGGRRSHADHSSLRSSAAQHPGRTPPAAG